ncbi:DUF1285 domain-containing protein [Alteromonas sediminis]|uniref:DUF1285 domain-containing protein n=1 Tax=Alteromonas sediminis TaxID=2259342 RepID=A0A3N5Z7P2_9ALTE|nr:DUF1285 domain-containing protein [Alteromonas sediminis]RPJ66734.1 DUF1285 domain-containing protein [Alteromonas sediminis]
MDLSQLSASLRDSLDSLKDSSTGAPVESWDPPFCGDIPLKIAFDGTWLYQGTPFTRPKLVALFASVLKKEGNDYFLVTPAEKVKINVDDVPFVIIDWERRGTTIWVKTQTGSTFPLNSDHAVSCRPLPNQPDADIPYVKVRHNLYARFHQNVYYQMLDEADMIEQDGQTLLLLKSDGLSIILGQMKC